MRRQGGINNAALFGASQRSARDKLETMGGIQRNPRGILASSSALMQAVAPRPMAPAPMTPPPPMMPMVQPVVLPQVPMQTTVAPMVQQAPVQQQQQASMNPMQQAPIKLEDGGKIDVTKSPTAAPMTKLQLAMFNVGSGIYEKVLGKYGSEEKAKEEIVKKKDEIEEVTSTTDNPVEIANAVLTSMGEEPTDDNKRDVAENVFGLTDVNDIDAINDRIAKVAVASTIGGGTQGTDKLASALLLGLQSYKQTAAARASGGAGGEKARQEFLYNDVFRKTYDTAMEQNPQDPDGALAQARQAAQIAAPAAPSALQGGGSPTPSTPREQVEEALRLEPNRRDEILKQATENGVNVEGL